MRLPICGMIAGALLVLAQPAAADDADTCSKASGDVAIASCSRAIASMTYSGHLLAVLYNNRGAKFQRKGDADLAIADYTEAIRLDPKYANAYYNRGLTWEIKGKKDSAIADHIEADRLGNANAAARLNALGR